MTVNIPNIKQELVEFLRNQDILSVATRGITTYSDTGTFASDSTYTLSNGPTAVKNIRSIVVAAVTKSLGIDYTWNKNTGVITFTSAQTGDYTIGYDSGSDKIYPDFPRDDLTISSYPRIAIDISSVPTDAFGIGGDQFISDINITVIVYADDADDIDTYIQSIKDAMVSNAKLFFYLNFVKPTGTGPLIDSPDRSTEIMHRNLEFQGMYKLNRREND